MTLVSIFVSTGHVHDMAVNEWGHTVLCAVVSVVDDTSLVSKVVCNELRVSFHG